MTDAELWEWIARSDSIAHVGIREVDGKRGVYRGVLQVPPATWKQGRTALEEIDGSSVLLLDSAMAMVRVKLRSPDALAAVRRLPLADYVEPARMMPTGAHESVLMTSFGCGNHPWDGSYPYLASSNPGEDVLSTYYTEDFMAISNAWRRSNGQGVTIGFVDTGIDPGQPQLTSGFAAPGTPSEGRTSKYLKWTGSQDQADWADQCGHGTRIAQVAAGPDDNQNTVGVAWKANLVMVRHDNDVFTDPLYYYSFDSYQAGQAISRAGENGARIIAMAWGSLTSYSYVSDVIDSWYYGSSQVLFIGAAGTSKCDPTLDMYKDDVVFPARKTEVAAVTGVNYHGYVSCESHYGPEVELAAHVYQVTAGARNLGHADVVTMDGSSNATGTIAGIAALIWSRYPWMTRGQVRTRLHESGSYYPTSDGRIGYGITNAHKALGGMWSARLDNCPNKTDCELHYKLPSCKTYTYYVTHSGGDGPFGYSWSTGSTSNSASMELCPTAGKTEYYWITVTVTDHSDGTSLYRQAKLRVDHSDPDGACPTCPL